uniref:Sulfhydryl oxidase n=1 Tax=Pithovirus LCDPAC01 TaxID=2506600 RepID=A0A481YQC8_9VIRU|nr:MAG: Erv1/Alr family disulfide (thiol) oxidoreductase [Pithovirus LCDPAC01]
MNEHKKNPYWWASGTWFNIHAFAKNATTIDTRKAFSIYLDIISSEIPCLKCQTHMKTYIRRNPIIYASDCFVWSWNFHNAINKMTKTKPIEYNALKRIYMGKNRICTNCGDDKPIRNSIGKKITFIRG